MLHPEYLHELIEIGGRALEQEDRFIAGCVATRPHLYGDKDQPGGLLRFRDERYYQVIIRRALMSGYRYRVSTEEGKPTYDFVLRETSGGDWLAVGEMKKWTGEEAELPGMREDIAKLQEAMRKYRVSGFFIVAAGWPPTDAGRQLEVIQSGLKTHAAPAAYRFRTIGWTGPKDREREFALLGFEVPPIS